MLKDLLKFEKFGGKDELIFILFDVLSLNTNRKIEDIKKYAISNHFSIAQSFDAIIELLRFASIVDIHNNIITVNDQLFDPNAYADKKHYFIESKFIEFFFKALKKESAIQILFNPDSLGYNYEEDKYFVKENLLPYSYFPIRNLLLNIGFFHWENGDVTNHLIINSIYNNTFKTVISWIDNVRVNSKHKISIDQVKDGLILKEQLGIEAEEFVLKYEKRRLENHPNNALIKRVSNEFANAGYDIESFNSINDILIDRFIEVKSFANEISFYWTKNELNTAIEFGNEYFLYLVDRTKMQVANYQPIILQNPYEKVFENEYWKKQVESWKIIFESD